jgi:hypothetical protein
MHRRIVGEVHWEGCSTGSRPKPENDLVQGSALVDRCCSPGLPRASSLPLPQSCLGDEFLGQADVRGVGCCEDLLPQSFQKSASAFSHAG